MIRKRKALEQSEHLPEEFRPLFWDHDFRKLGWERDRDFIISRLLSHGDWQALQWLRSQVDSVSLRNWLLARRGAGLSSCQLRFWELILGLPHREVKEWLQEEGRKVWERRAG
jgi:hypothetical protein